MTIISGVMIVLVGLIHLLPVMGVLGVERLTSLYGIQINDPNLAILMQHRAVLFGLLGGFLVYAGFVMQLRLLAYIAAFVSVGTFIVLAWSIGGYNAQVGKVVLVDLVALGGLVIGLVAEIVGRYWVNSSV